jgi:hypothetical protein
MITQSEQNTPDTAEGTEFHVCVTQLPTGVTIRTNRTQLNHTQVAIWRGYKTVAELCYYEYRGPEWMQQIHEMAVKNWSTVNA